jgi:hypothetical protein
MKCRNALSLSSSEIATTSNPWSCSFWYAAFTMGIPAMHGPQVVDQNSIKTTSCWLRFAPQQYTLYCSAFSWV